MTTLRISCAAILFDLDGVLVHSAEAVRRAWLRWAREHNLPPHDVQAAAHGRRTIDTVRAFIGEPDAAVQAAQLEEAQSRDTVGITAGVGAHRLLDTLPDSSWAVVTSATRILALARLAATGLPRPAHLVCADDVTRGKPDPAGYRLGAAAVGQPPEECVVIEDAAAGVSAARAAGMRVIGICGSQPPEELAGADAVIPTLADIELEPGSDGRLHLLLTRTIATNQTAMQPPAMRTPR